METKSEKKEPTSSARVESGMQTENAHVANAIFRFLKGHTILLALVASASWFYAGHKNAVRGSLFGAFLWEIIGVLILVAYCVGDALTINPSWFSIGVAVAAIVAEGWFIKQWLAGLRPKA